MPPFDKVHTTSCSPFTKTDYVYLVPFSRYSELFVESRIFPPHVYLAPPFGVTHWNLSRPLALEN